MKARVYGFCDAGCQWETVLKDDFDRIASVIKQKPDADGSYNVNPLNAYKVHTDKIYYSDGTTSGYKYKVDFYLQSESVDYQFEYTEYDEYRDYIIFEVLSLNATNDNKKLTIVYEINGNRYSDTYENSNIDVSKIELHITDATEVYTFNNNAEIIADNQQTYETAVDSEGDECPDTLNLDDVYFTIPAAMYAGQRMPKVGDLLIYRFNVANKSGQDTILCRITSVDNQGGVNMQAICFVQGAGASGGGGTTLNKYTFTISSSTAYQTAANRARVYRIFEQAKGRVMAQGSVSTETAITGAISSNGYLYLSATSIYYYSSKDEYTTVIASEFIDSSGSRYSKYRTRFEPDGSITHDSGGVFGNKITITYWNDVEIV